MEIQQEQRTLTRSSNFKKVRYKTADSPDAIKIMIARLYQNKIRAIVRELCSNAHDAHVLAGKENIPFKVKGPTQLAATLEVKDWGPGIDPDKFEEIYTTCLMSNKKHTNDQVGCFGLGSKSPFCYTDMFSVENSYGGTTYYYTCYMDEEGYPCISLLNTSPAEETGLKVIVPVRPKDFAEFNNEIVSVLGAYDVAPICNINLGPKIDWSEEIVLVDGNHTLVSPNKYHIRMGQVIYPMDQKTIDSFQTFFTRTHWTNDALVFNVPIGSADITPAREQLEMTQKTKSHMLSFPAKLESFLKNKLEENLKGDETKIKQHSVRLFNKTKYCLSDRFSLTNPIDEKAYREIMKEYLDSLQEDFLGIEDFLKVCKISKQQTLYYRDLDYIHNDMELKPSQYKKLIISKRGKYGSVIVVDNDLKSKLMSLGFEENDFTSFKYLREKELENRPERKKSYTGSSNNCQYFILYEGSYITSNNLIGDKINPTDRQPIQYIEKSDFESIKNKNWYSKFFHTLLQNKKVYVFSERQIEKLSNKNDIDIMKLYKNFEKENLDQITTILIFEHYQYLYDGHNIELFLNLLKINDSELSFWIERNVSKTKQLYVNSLENQTSLLRTACQIFKNKNCHRLNEELKEKYKIITEEIEFVLQKYKLLSSIYDRLSVKNLMHYINLEDKCNN